MSTSTISLPTSPPIPTQTTIVKIGESGNRVEWATCILLVVASVSIALHSLYVHKKSRAFHLIATLVTAIMAMVHYAIATGSGSILFKQRVIHHETFDEVVFRQSFYVRFVSWFAISPLLCLFPALLSGLAWIDTLMMIVVDELAVICVLMAAVVDDSTTMWGWFGFFVLLVICVFYIMIIKARRAASLQPDHITSLYVFVCTTIFLLGIIFISLIGLGDGAGKISVNTQAIVLAIGDLGLCVFIPVVLIYFYQKKVDDHGHGHMAIPDHLFDHRDHGWEAGVQLERD